MATSGAFGLANAFRNAEFLSLFRMVLINQRSRFKSTFLCVLALCAFLPAFAQPLNFMVGAHVFSRPEAWEWVDLPQKSTMSAKLLIHGKPGEADVVFVESKASGGWASADETIARWRKNFIQSSEAQNLQREQHKLAKATVTFLWQEGTYKTTGNSGAVILHSDFAQYGVIIENGTNNVLARVLGDKAVVAKAREEFQKLVETALSE
ncbi:MAG: hypothetical protein JWM68_2869 [Verrucomicrobiales bacterium]|nr:hypothetical protein [Verrucomicrobiales bacterium]